MGVVDILPRCVSSVYLYYDPKVPPRSLTWPLTRPPVPIPVPGHPDLPPGAGAGQDPRRHLPAPGKARQWPGVILAQVTSYYLGFYIHTCVKMRYKGRYSPSFLACPETFSWRPIADCTHLLDRWLRTLTQMGEII